MNRSLREPRPLLLGLFACACTPSYEPPHADQPHALLKLRRTYEVVAGTGLSEQVKVDEHGALQTSTRASVARVARMDSILVHPLPATFSVGNNFFHPETRFVQESYQEPQTTYVQESYSCSSGFGTTMTYTTCYRTVPQTTYQTKYRTVWRTVDVSDGYCSTNLRFAPKDGHIYLLQYTYHHDSVCDLSCFEQVQGENGGFKNLKCPAAPPEE